MTTMYFANYEACEPEAVECAVPEYPNKDAKGRTICENTHFLRIEDCWRQVLTEMKAGLRLSTRDLVRAEQEVVRAKDQVAEDAKALLAAETKHADFLKRQVGGAA